MRGPLVGAPGFGAMAYLSDVVGFGDDDLSIVLDDAPTADILRWRRFGSMCESDTTGGYPSRSSDEAPEISRFALSQTASNIGSVSRPVNVFCWLGW